MRPALLAIAAVLLLVTIAVQVAYARAYGKSANRTTKVIWGFNIALLLALLGVLVWFAAVM